MGFKITRKFFRRAVRRLEKYLGKIKTPFTGKVSSNDRWTILDNQVATANKQQVK
jgi:hypothetical protein